MLAHRDDIVAVKFWSGYYGSPLDPEFKPFYELAREFDKPVIFHTGRTGGAAPMLDCHPYLRQFDLNDK